MMKQNKSKWIAAFLNFLLPGLGYLYTGSKRTLYSWGLFILSIGVGIHDYTEISQILQLKAGLSEHFVLFIILYPLVFAWDAYKDVEEGRPA